MTPEELKKILIYNPATGDFVWLARELRAGIERLDKGWNTRFAGKLALPRYHRHGHQQIGLFCKNYMAHRVAWALYYGIWPTRDIDHIDGNPRNNRINNLRLATASQNQCNAKKREDNTSGVKGVSRCSRNPSRWVAYINHGGHRIPLGRFDRFENAVAVRDAAAEKYHGEFGRKE